PKRPPEQLFIELGLFRINDLFILLVVDPHRKCVDKRIAVVYLEQPVAIANSHDPVGRTQKMPCIVVGMKADQVGSKHTFKDAFAPRQQPEHFVRGKWYMLKKPN